ncbi:hypothetical protein ACE193_17905 [Bernardetia sp. OM2101]|uniref:hypothetical protein n=1 Tax=Bernardetia sp. OM2101 TaxID=3344876 RepID=UPI0035D05C0A
MTYDLSDVEVHGQDILSFMDALSLVPLVGKAILKERQIGVLVDGNYQIMPNDWYLLSDKITILKDVLKRIGPASLKKVGKKIPENANFPPEIDDIHKAISSINIAYHMNHRKNGKLMFDEKTGQITEGIGYYGYEAVKGENKIISVCENPNVSEYDEGILEAMARRFESRAKVVLDTTKPTRRTGGDSCTFIITW